jgi:hypothetical protein
LRQGFPGSERAKLSALDDVLFRTGAGYIWAVNASMAGHWGQVS